jgi:hypothetical protein
LCQPHHHDYTEIEDVSGDTEFIRSHFSYPFL